MKRHLSDSEIQAYQSRNASTEELLAIDDHLTECDQCRRLLATPEKLQKAYEEICRILDSEELMWEEHLTYEQLAGFVDGTSNADDRRFVLEHIQSCEECRSDLREFRKLKQQIEQEERSRPTPAKRHSPAALWHMQGYRWAFGLALLVAALTGSFWIYAHQMQVRLAGQRSAIARLEQMNKNPGQRTEERPPGATIVIQDGSRQIALNKNGELVGLGDIPADYVSALKEAMKTGGLPLPSPPETNMGRVAELQGADEREKGFEVVSPTGTVVEDTRPLFEWQRLAGAREYTVMIKDLASGAESESPATGNTSWTRTTALIRGHQYAWMVEASVGSRRVRAPAPDKPYATFKVLDAQEADEISRVRKLYGDSHLIMGLADSKAGILEQAEHEFAALLAANPNSSVARNLLASVAGKPAGINR